MTTLQELYEALTTDKAGWVGEDLVSLHANERTEFEVADIISRKKVDRRLKRWGVLVYIADGYGQWMEINTHTGELVFNNLTELVHAYLGQEANSMVEDVVDELVEAEE